MSDEQKEKQRDYQKEYVKNMSDEQKQRLPKRVLCIKKIK